MRTVGATTPSTFYGRQQLVKKQAARAPPDTHHLRAWLRASEVVAATVVVAPPSAACVRRQETNKRQERMIMILVSSACLFPTHSLAPHLGFTGFPTTHFCHDAATVAGATGAENKSIRRLPIIINLLKFVVLSSLRCLVPVRFSIIGSY